MNISSNRHGSVDVVKLPQRLVMANAPADADNLHSPSQSHGNSMIVHPDGNEDDRTVMEVSSKTPVAPCAGQRFSAVGGVSSASSSGSSASSTERSSSTYSERRSRSPT